MTVTFELASGRLLELGWAQSLALASLALPDGAYTTFRTYHGGRVLRLADHVHRLEETVALEGQAAALEKKAVRRAVAQALDLARYPESRLRVTFAPPRLFVSIEPFAPLPERCYREGVACVTLPLRRENPRAKDTRFIATAAGVYGKLPPGVHEGLLVGEDGAILEGLSSNFFGIRDGVLMTEEGDVLPGITREVVLEVATGVVPESRIAVHTGEIAALAEAFITSASRGILPVVRIDEATIGDGRPGPLTRELTTRLDALIERETESPANW